MLRMRCRWLVMTLLRGNDGDNRGEERSAYGRRMERRRPVEGEGQRLSERETTKQVSVVTGTMEERWSRYGRRVEGRRVESRILDRTVDLLCTSPRAFGP